MRAAARARAAGLADVAAPGVDVDRVDRLAGRDEEAVALRAAERDVGGALRQQDLTDPLAVGREDLDAVDAFPIHARRRAGPAPEVAVLVDAHAVRADLCVVRPA